MRAELANLNHRAVTFLSRTTANLCWYYYTLYTVYVHVYSFCLNETYGEYSDFTFTTFYIRHAQHF